MTTPPQPPYDGQPPHSAPPPPIGPTTPGKRRGALIAGFVAATLVALGLGVTIGAATFGSGDSSDAALACKGVDTLPDDESLEDLLKKGESSMDEPYLDRITGIGGFSMAAAKDDDEFETLGEHGEGLFRGIQTFELDRAQEDLDDLREECDDLGL